MMITPEHIFEFANLMILPAWLMLIIAPQWRWTRSLVMTGNYSLAYAVLYIVIIIMNFDVETFNFSTLKNVQMLFSNSHILLAGWVHYLAFDLLIGAWITKDANKVNINHLYIIPVLIFTFYLGPVGYLAYCVTRCFKLLKAKAR